VKVGMSLFLQNPNYMSEVGGGPTGFSDLDVYKNELELAGQAELMGFDSLWSVEHHFSGYTMNPDVLMFLAYMAGRTTSIELGSMVVVLPWHATPIRVAESAAMLDNLSGGRFTLGIGRGLGRLEFEGLGVPMGESRTRFVESASMIIQGLNDGYIDFQGEHYSQERRYIRPTPVKGFQGRVYAAAVSPESSRIMAKLGVGLLVIPQKPWETTISELAEYRALYEEVQHEPAPAPIVACSVFVDEDGARAADMAYHYIGEYYRTVLKHYELTGTHFEKVEGYEHYAQGARAMRERGEDSAADFYTELQVFGTPDECVDKIAKIAEDTGTDHFLGVFSYGGLAHDEAMRNLGLFNDKVQPRIKAL
jgi:alkanesulfonate monooxygenase SsuD/methylene tetrahydromethanopterin reductase-like flavin-dependent oxidoreductase (luciferase family)